MSQDSSIEKQKLLQARELITAKQYDQARVVLETISHHEIAQKWLAKLDEIAPRATRHPNWSEIPDSPPRPAPPPDPLRATATYSTAKPKKKKRSVKNLANQPLIEFRSGFDGPFNPFFAGLKYRVPTRLRLVLIFLIYGFGLANNWPRLGKPRWQLPTMLMSLASFGLSILLVLGGITVINQVNFLQPLPNQGLPIANLATYGLLGLGLGLNFAFILSTIYLQWEPYSKWQTFGRKAMLNHHYDFITSGLIAILIILVSLFIGAGYGYYVGL